MSLTQKDLDLNREFYISNSALVANVIAEAIRCKAYPTLPRKIDTIVEKVTELYSREFEKASDDFYLRVFTSYQELYLWLKEHLLAIPEIEEMNLSQKEFDAGVKVNDENRDKYYITSRYCPAPPEEDVFVDLNAYVRNVCHGLIRDCIEINFASFM